MSPCWATITSRSKLSPPVPPASRALPAAHRSRTAQPCTRRPYRPELSAPKPARSTPLLYAAPCTKPQCCTRLTAHTQGGTRAAGKIQEPVELRAGDKPLHEQQTQLSRKINSTRRVSAQPLNPFKAFWLSWLTEVTGLLLQLFHPSLAEPHLIRAGQLPVLCFCLEPPCSPCLSDN